MSNKKLTAEEIVSALEKHNGNASAAARELGIAPRTMRRWAAAAKSGLADKRKLTSVKQTDGTLDPEALHQTPDALISKYGLDPKKWVPVKLDVNEADAGTATAPKVRRTVALTVAPIPELPKPAFGGRPINIKPPKRRKANERNTELVFIVSDYHAPYAEEGLHQASLRHIQEAQPDRIIINGDLVDFSNLGRHRKTTNDCQATASECIEAGGKILAELRAAAPKDCRIQLIPGNHDAWLSNYLLSQAGELYDLKAYGEEKPVWSFANLLRLEELGVELVGEPHEYPHNYISLTPHLIVHHGETARKNAGASALGTMANQNYASIIGHVHRQGIVSKTFWVIDPKTNQRVPRVYQGGECGTMSQISGEPGNFPTYGTTMDWAQGYLTAEIDPSGYYSLETATYQGGKLFWRGKEW